MCTHAQCIKYSCQCATNSKSHCVFWFVAILQHACLCWDHQKSKLVANLNLFLLLQLRSFFLAAKSSGYGKLPLAWDSYSYYVFILLLKKKKVNITNWSMYTVSLLNYSKLTRFSRIKFHFICAHCNQWHQFVADTMSNNILTWTLDKHSNSLL